MRITPPIRHAGNCRPHPASQWFRHSRPHLFRNPGRGKTQRGFTLLELTIVLVLISTLSAVGVPTYVGYVHSTRETKAIHDIHVLDRIIATYEHTNGDLPDSLDDTGEGGRLDPWGNPYEYLRVAQTRKGRKELIKRGVLENETLTKAEKKALDKRKPRKDRFLKPVNTDYDLYSKGPDGLSKPDLNRKVSRDDIVRVVDGGFIGRAIDF